MKIVHTKKKWDQNLPPIPKVTKNDVGKKVIYREMSILPDGSIAYLRGVITDMDLKNPASEGGPVIWVKIQGQNFPLPLFQRDLAWPEAYYRANKCVGLF